MDGIGKAILALMNGGQKNEVVFAGGQDPPSVLRNFDMVDGFAPARKKVLCVFAHAVVEAQVAGLAADHEIAFLVSLQTGEFVVGGVDFLIHCFVLRADSRVHLEDVLLVQTQNHLIGREFVKLLLVRDLGYVVNSVSVYLLDYLASFQVQLIDLVLLELV